VNLPEILLHNLFSDLEAQDPALYHRMVIMKPGIDSRSLNFVRQVVGAGERMRITSYFAVHGKCEVWSPEISGENGRDRPSHATVRGGILRVAGRTHQRQPIWISREGGVASSRLDCSYKAARN